MAGQTTRAIPAVTAVGGLHSKWRSFNEHQGESPAAIHQHPQVLFVRAVLYLYIPQLVVVVGLL